MVGTALTIKDVQLGGVLSPEGGLSSATPQLDLEAIIAPAAPAGVILASATTPKSEVVTWEDKKEFERFAIHANHLEKDVRDLIERASHARVGIGARSFPSFESALNESSWGETPTRVIWRVIAGAVRAISLGETIVPQMVKLDKQIETLSREILLSGPKGASERVKELDKLRLDLRYAKALRCGGISNRSEFEEALTRCYESIGELTPEKCRARLDDLRIALKPAKALRELTFRSHLGGQKSLSDLSDEQRRLQMFEALGVTDADSLLEACTTFANAAESIFARAPRLSSKQLRRELESIPFRDIFTSFSPEDRNSPSSIAHYFGEQGEAMFEAISPSWKRFSTLNHLYDNSGIFREFSFDPYEYFNKEAVIREAQAITEFETKFRGALEGGSLSFRETVPTTYSVTRGQQDVDFSNPDILHSLGWDPATYEQTNAAIASVKPYSEFLKVIKAARIDFRYTDLQELIEAVNDTNAQLAAGPEAMHVASSKTLAHARQVIEDLATVVKAIEEYRLPLPESVIASQLKTLSKQSATLGAAIERFRGEAILSGLR